MNTKISFSEYKKKLVATKVADIDDFSELTTIFLVLSASLTGDEPSDEQPVLKLDTLSVWFTRALQMSKIHKDFMTQFSEAVSDTQLIGTFDHLCQMYETSTGPFANAAFGLLSKLLQFVNRYIENTRNKTIASRLVITVKSIPATQKCFFIITECLIKEIDGAISALSQYSFPEKCIDILWSSALANSASKAFASFYVRLHDPKSSTPAYIDAWSPLVVKSLNSSNLRLNIINHLLPKLFRDCPHAYISWVKSLDITRGHINWRVLMLPLLRCAYAISTSIDPIESGAISETDIYELLQHSDESCRLDSFALVCSAISATKEPSSHALKMMSDPSVLVIFFRESTTPESRSAFFSLLRRALLNCRDFICTQNKRLAKKPNAEQEIIVEKAKACLINVLDFVTSQFVPDSSYAQLILSSDIIKLFIEFEFDGVPRELRKDVKSSSKIIEIFSPKFAATVLRFASNNYDDIRQQCAFIFEQCPYAVFEQIHSDIMIKNTLTLLSSLKGRQSDGGANVMGCVAQMFVMHTEFDKYFELLHLILSSMNNSLRESLPVHGYLAAIGQLLPLIPPKKSDEYHPQIEPIVTSLLHTVFQLWEISKPLMTQAPYEVEDISEMSVWRSIKESALLLKILMKFNADREWRAFSTVTYLGICDLLMDQLGNITHKGALSAIYPTFVLACELCNRVDLENKPAEWLRRNLNLLETKEQLISRRSAGIPYLIIGILNSSVPKSRKLEDYLKQSFEELFRVSESVYIAKDDEKFDIPQVHALNCIKCIFREASLGPVVSVYLERALKISLNNLDNPTWAIKNGAIMLFTALQERLFGSSNERTEIIVAALFFEKFVNIKASLLDKLKNSKEDNVSFLILSMVSKLQSFSKDDQTLDEFQEVIKSRFLGHKAWKIREMAASSICAITHFDNYTERMNQLKPSEGLTANEVHGRMLCLLELSKLSNLSASDVDCTREVVELWIVQHIVDDDWTNIRTAILILSKTGFSEKVFSVLSSKIETILSQRSALNGPRRLFIETAVTAVLNSCEICNVLIQLSQSFATTTCYEAQVSMIEFWAASPKLFATMTELHESIIEMINSKETWSHVERKAMKLLILSGIPLEKSLVSISNVAVSMTSLALVLDARSRCSSEEKFCESALQHSADSGTEEDRYNAVLASKSVLRTEIKKRSVKAKLLFLLYERVSDESSYVRKLAGEYGSCAEINRKTQLDHLCSDFPAECFDLFLESVKQGILDDLKNLNHEKGNTDFEIERSNLYRNEVREHQELARRLAILMEKVPESETLVTSVTSFCLELVSKAVEENKGLLASWTFNVHLDSAIKKVVQLCEICSETNKMEISRLRDELGKLNYIL